MESNFRFYNVLHTSPELNTVGAYINDINSPAHRYANDEDGFLAIKDEKDVSNRDRLFDSYSAAEKAEHKNKIARDLPIKVGVRFIIPVDKVDRNGLLTQGLQIVTNNDVAFKANELAKLEADAGYISITKPVDGQITNGITKQSVPEVTVWVWCRALSGKYEDGMKGQILDVTPFIQNLNTKMSKNGGNFSFTLPPLICEQITDGTWQIHNGSMIQYEPGSMFTSVDGQGYVAEGSLFDENMKRNSFYFHNVIKSNDLVFIRFETLQMEAKERYNNTDGNLYIDKAQLPGKIYDMIGLVDVDASSLNPASTDANITIAGRDLSKLFIEDGSYFYALEQSNAGKVGFAGSSSINSGLFQRVMSEGQLLFFNLWYNSTIEKSFAFVLNQLTNTKIVPDELFTAYGKRRNTTFKLIDNPAYKGKPKQEILDGYRTKAISGIKSVRKKLQLTYFLPGVNQSAEQQIFNDIKSFLQTIRDNGCRLVSGTVTSGWKEFVWVNPGGVSETVRKSVFPKYFSNKLFKTEILLAGKDVPYSSTYIDIITNIDNYLDLENSTGKFTERYKEQYASGIWQIIKLVVDRSIVDRRIVDSSLSTAQGSIINFFRKICQAPFVEYFADTYGDTYNLTVRKPITDQVSLISMLEGRVRTEKGYISTRPVIIDIEPEDVLSENLFFDDSEVRSWYHLTTKYNIGGSSSAYHYFHLPALYFEEYAEIWGSRPMDIVSNYMPHSPNYDASAEQSGFTHSQRQAVHDLKFMVDSNMANPFMRRGTLVINGDRRVKVGNFIRYVVTGEIFQIDDVVQDFKSGENGSDRTTTLVVSRGMVEQLIYGVPYQKSKNQEVDHISYFNLINTKLNYRYTTQEVEETRQVQEGFQLIPSLPLLGDRYPAGTLFDLQQAQFQLNGVGTTTIVKNKGLDKLTSLQPQVQAVFIQFINAINQLTMNGAPILVEITSALRTRQEQEILYNQNKLNAKPGNSPHEAERGGLAIDINLVYRSPGRVFAKQIKKGDTVAMWKSTGVPQLAKELGLLWGGDSFNNYYDPVHFQVVPTSVGERRPIFKTVTSKRNVQVLDQTAIFSNFKVNKHVLEFFLRGEQFAKKYNRSEINRTIYRKDVKAALG